MLLRFLKCFDSVREDEYIIGALCTYTYLHTHTHTHTHTLSLSLSNHNSMQSADVLLVDGRIAAVGSSLKDVPGARTIDAKGKLVIPGVNVCG